MRNIFHVLIIVAFFDLVYVYLITAVALVAKVVIFLFFVLNSWLPSLIASVKRMHHLLHHLRTPASQSRMNSRTQDLEMLKMRPLVQLRKRLQNLDQRQASALRKITGVLPALVYEIHCTVKHQVCNNTIS